MSRNKNSYGMSFNESGIYVDSRSVAETYDTSHGRILSIIDSITDEDSGFSDEFLERNFIADAYHDVDGSAKECYKMTREGFSVLAAILKDDHVRNAYNYRFDDLESQVRSLDWLMIESPMLMEALEKTHSNEDIGIYRSELSMISAIATGFDIEELHEIEEIPADEPMGDYLQSGDAELFECLFTVDVGLVYSGICIHERERILERYAREWREENAA